MLRTLTAALLALAVAASLAVAQQTKPTQAELDAWEKNPNAKMLESSPCKKITWLLEAEEKRPRNEQQIVNALGWWGRGFIEGAVYMVGEKAMKAADSFGLSVDVVSAHIKTYCYGHQDNVPADAIQDLLLKVLKTAEP